MEFLKKQSGYHNSLGIVIMMVRPISVPLTALNTSEWLINNWSPVFESRQTHRWPTKVTMLTPVPGGRVQYLTARPRKSNHSRSAHLLVLFSNRMLHLMLESVDWSDRIADVLANFTLLHFDPRSISYCILSINTNKAAVTLTSDEMKDLQSNKQ